MATAYVRIWLAMREIKHKDPHWSVARRAALVVAKVNEILHPAPQSSSLNENSSERQYSRRSLFHPENGSGGSLEETFSDYQRSQQESSGSTLSGMDEPATTSLSSQLYDWCRKLFLTPELGYIPADDPLSQEGQELAFRQHLREKAVEEARIGVSFFTGPFVQSSDHHPLASDILGRDHADDSGTMLRPKSPFELPGSSFLKAAPPGSTAITNLRDMNAYETQASGEGRKFRIEEKGALDISTHNLVSVLCFHAYLDLLAVADGDKVGIWSLKDCSLQSTIQQSLRSFQPLASSSSSSSAGVAPKLFSEKHARITAMSWLNQSSDSLLMVGSDDGALCVWRDNGDVSSGSFNPGDFDTKSGRATQAAAFHALPDIADTSSGSGMIFSWQQSTGSLVTAGNSSTIRLWDVSREQCVRIFQTGLDTCTSALSSLTLSASQTALFSPHTVLPPTSGMDFDPPPVMMLCYSTYCTVHILQYA